MEEVHRGWIRNFVKWTEPEGLGNFRPQYSPEQIPDRESETKSPEAEAKCEIRIKFLTFSCTNFVRIS